MLNKFYCQQTLTDQLYLLYMNESRRNDDASNNFSQLNFLYFSIDVNFRHFILSEYLDEMQYILSEIP